MALEPYSQARKLAVKNFRSDSSRGIYPYLQVLDEILSYTDIVAETELGLVDIPLESIVGTKSAGRTNAFASNFMPLLSESSEFSSKWSNLYESHMKEGIRDPIRAYEFMNHFYVSEENKRVSILKFCDAVTIPGYVTRIIPKPNHTKENRIYYEFLNFYKECGINYLNFSQIGNYKKILELLGKNFHSTWTDDEKKTFHASYYRFLKIFEKKKEETFL